MAALGAICECLDTFYATETAPEARMAAHAQLVAWQASGGAWVEGVGLIEGALGGGGGASEAQLWRWAEFGAAALLAKARSEASTLGTEDRRAVCARVVGALGLLPATPPPAAMHAFAGLRQTLAAAAAHLAGLDAPAAYAGLDASRGLLCIGASAAVFDVVSIARGACGASYVHARMNCELAAVSLLGEALRLAETAGASRTSAYRAALEAVAAWAVAPGDSSITIHALEAARGAAPAETLLASVSRLARNPAGGPAPTRRCAALGLLLVTLCNDKSASGDFVAVAADALDACEVWYAAATLNDDAIDEIARQAALLAVASLSTPRGRLLDIATHRRPLVAAAAAMVNFCALAGSGDDARAVLGRVVARAAASRSEGDAGAAWRESVGNPLAVACARATGLADALTDAAGALGRAPGAPFLVAALAADADAASPALVDAAVAALADEVAEGATATDRCEAIDALAYAARNRHAALATAALLDAIRDDEDAADDAASALFWYCIENDLETPPAALARL